MERGGDCCCWCSRPTCEPLVRIESRHRLSVTELRVLNILSHFRYLKQSLRIRNHVTS